MKQIDKDIIMWNIEDGIRFPDLRLVAKNDGLSYYQFTEWFFPGIKNLNKPFAGAIIHFTDFRYGQSTRE